MRTMRKLLYLLILGFILASPGASQPASAAKESAYQMEPPPEIPQPLLELKAEKERLEASLEEAWGKLGERPGRPPRRMGPGHPMAGPLRWHVAARGLGQKHEILGELDRVKRELDRVIQDAWDTYDGIIEGDLPDFPPPPPENRKRLQHWMAKTFGQPRPEPPLHPIGHPPWREMIEKGAARRLELLLLRLERMEKRIAELEETVQRQQEEIQRLRDQIESGAIPPPEKATQ